MNPYKEEIIHAHAAIENWLSKGVGSLEALIARFAADFTMITPGGLKAISLPIMQGGLILYNSISRLLYFKKRQIA